MFSVAFRVIKTIMTDEEAGMKRFSNEILKAVQIILVSFFFFINKTKYTYRLWVYSSDFNDLIALWVLSCCSLLHLLLLSEHSLGSALWSRKMKIVCSRQVWYEQTNERTNGRTKISTYTSWAPDWKCTRKDEFKKGIALHENVIEAIPSAMILDVIRVPAGNFIHQITVYNL